MRKVKIERKDGREELVDAYAWDEVPLDELPDSVLISQRGEGHYKIGYVSDFCTFDIETTTMPGVRNAKGDYLKEPWAFMYQWQACVCGKLVMGRYWDEFFNLLERMRDHWKLKNLKRMVIYVHFLGYENSFLYPLFRQRCGKVDIFARKPHEPIKITLADWGFEFRCSQIMTNMNLYMFTKTELGSPYQKAWGDLDYKKIRTAKSRLSAKELNYCALDVIALYWAIKAKMHADRDTIASIPITSTGYPRRVCRKACRKFKDYRKKYFEKCLLTPEVYALLKEEARGGNTHANRYYAGKIYEDVDSYDEVSEYPAAMLLYDYPMGKFSRYGDLESLAELDAVCAKYACLFRITFRNLKLRPDAPMPYVSIDKLTYHSGPMRGDNGRLLEIDGICSMTLNEIDWGILKEQYTWDPGVIVQDLHICPKAPLPEPIRETILQFFTTKCKLKKEIKRVQKQLDKDPDNVRLIDQLNLLNYRYGKTKNMLNGIFGMMFTDPVKERITLQDDGKWTEALPPGKTVEDMVDKYNSSRNSFLSYQWGCWVPAYGRKMLDDVQKCTRDASGNYWAIYSDTDSSKSQYWDKKALDDLVARQIKLCEERGAYYEHEDGKREYMGYPELDGRYSRFKTLGAKKYAYEDEEGMLHVTVSGVSNTCAPGEKMGAGAKELQKRGGLDVFTIGFKFREAGGSCVWHRHAEPHEITVNGCTMLTASYAAITDGEYTVGVKEEYGRLIGLL